MRTRTGTTSAGTSGAGTSGAGATGGSRRGAAAAAPPDPASPYHHGDLREALVAEAFSRVRAQGAEAVSLRAVAQAVGVSPSAAYHHFPDKTAILVEVADRGARELDRRAVAAVEGLGVEDAERGLARLSAVGAAYIGFAVDEPHLFRHTFGPYCAMTVKGLEGQADGAPEGHEHATPESHRHAATEGHDQAETEGHDGRAVKGPDVDPDSAYGLLVDTLDRLDDLGALRRRDGVDLVAWAAVHGFAGLVLEGFVPAEAASVLVDVLSSLVVSPQP